MKFGSIFSVVSAAFVIALVILNGCLLKQNISYKWENRKLILQNDSLMAVTIQLNQAMSKKKSDSLLGQQLNKPTKKRKKG
jgi:hypothetical protein